MVDVLGVGGLGFVVWNKGQIYRNTTCMTKLGSLPSPSCALCPFDSDQVYAWKCFRCEQFICRGQCVSGRGVVWIGALE